MQCARFLISAATRGGSFGMSDKERAGYMQHMATLNPGPDGCVPGLVARDVCCMDCLLCAGGCV